MDALIRFFATPAGKKYNEEFPKVANEAVGFSMVWTRDLGREIQDRLQKAGYAKRN